MKNLKTYMVMSLFAILTPALTSCDDDPWNYYDYNGDWYSDYNWYEEPFDYGTNSLQAEAQCLRGYWTGTMIEEYTDDYGNRQSSQMDVEIIFDQYDSNSLNGRGQETDYIGNESRTLRFSWYIAPRTGDIYVKYDGSLMTFKFDAYSKARGFNLDDYELSGYMLGQNNDEVLYVELGRTTFAKKAPTSLMKAQSTGSRFVLKR